MYLQSFISRSIYTYIYIYVYRYKDHISTDVPVLHQISTAASQHDRHTMLYANVPISTAITTSAEDMGSCARPNQQKILLRTWGQPHVQTSNAVDHGANQHRLNQHGANGQEDQLQNHADKTHILWGINIVLPSSAMGHSV
jgi:hypothetical protein